MWRPLVPIIVGLVLFGEIIAGRQSTPPTSRTGTAVMAGVVVTGPDPVLPVRRATVRLALEGTTSARLVGTDENGRYVFEGLPAGRYTLSASKPGFVEAFHGSRHPGRGPGVPVAVGNTGRTEITLSLVRGAAITGIISDGLGRPAPFVAVVAVALRGSRAALIRAETDDRGVYRLFGLAPGEYLIAALPRLAQAAANISAVTDAEIQWALGQGPKDMPPPGRSVAYAPVFFPGTVDAGAASPVTVRAGEEQAGISLVLRIVNVSTLSGSILDANGVPAKTATVVLDWRRRGEPTSEVLVASGAITLPRATVTAPTFSISGVWPGDYTLIVSSRSGQRGTAPPDSQGPGVLWGISDVTVDGSDLTDIQVRLRPGLQMSGSYRFSGTRPPPDSSALDVTLARQGTPAASAGDVRANLEPAAGTLRFASVPPGRYVLKSSVGGPWFLESAMLDGRDLADWPLDVTTSGETHAGLVVTFSDRPAQIDGQLVDDTGAAITRYAVVVFPVAESQWHPLSRRVRLVRPATDGSFTIAGLPAGEYAIAAAEDIEAPDLDATLLSELRAVGHRLILAQGDRHRQTLKIVR